MSEAPTLVDAGRREAVGATVATMYERHARSLYGLCRMMLRDAHEAEDALQATFLAAHRALLRGSGPREEAAWLAAIARNECRGRIRARMSRPLEAPATALESVPDPSPTPDDRIRDPAVRRALTQLPESQRDAVVLHDVFGLRAREVGSVLGMSVPAVEALLFRGRRQLRGRLRPAQGALAVPASVREGIAQVVPGFAPGDAGPTVVGGAGAAGLGLLAKLTGAPALVKVATGVAALAAAGSVAVVGGERVGGARGSAPTPGSPSSAVPTGMGRAAPGIASTRAGGATGVAAELASQPSVRSGDTSSGRGDGGRASGGGGRGADDGSSGPDDGAVTRPAAASEPGDSSSGPDASEDAGPSEGSGDAGERGDDGASGSGGDRTTESSDGGTGSSDSSEEGVEGGPGPEDPADDGASLEAEVPESSSEPSGSGGGDGSSGSSGSSGGSTSGDSGSTEGPDAPDEVATTPTP